MQKNKQTKRIILFIALAVTAMLLFVLNLYDANNKVPIEKTPEEIVTGKQKLIEESIWKEAQIEDIFALQDILGSEIVMEIDCESIIEEKANTYCTKEKEFYIDFFNELTWGQVIQQWLENIDSFDCNEIVAEAGKQECRDYKNSK